MICRGSRRYKYLHTKSRGPKLIMTFQVVASEGNKSHIGVTLWYSLPALCGDPIPLLYFSISSHNIRSSAVNIGCWLLLTSRSAKLSCFFSVLILNFISSEYLSFSSLISVSLLSSSDWRIMSVQV